MTYSNADFTPGLKGYSDIKPFRFWCQKVLPLVYDDSLSYYELLCKVTDYINNIIDDLSATEDNVSALLDAYNQLQDYVNNYFTNLDVQEEINNKLDDLVEDGTLTELIGNYIDPRIEEIQEELDNYEHEITTNFNGLQSATESNLQQQNDKIFVLEGRMDTFTNLPTGSTSGDAELQDIRVAFDGAVYTTAGNAVRGQVGDLNSASIITDKTWTDGKYVAGSNVEITHSGYSIAEYDVSNFIGDVYFISYGSASVGWVLLDENNNVISRSLFTNSTGDTYKFTKDVSITDKATTLKISCNSTYKMAQMVHVKVYETILDVKSTLEYTNELQNNQLEVIYNQSNKIDTNGAKYTASQIAKIDLPNFCTIIDDDETTPVIRALPTSVGYISGNVALANNFDVGKYVISFDVNPSADFRNVTYVNAYPTPANSGGTNLLNTGNVWIYAKGEYQHIEYEFEITSAVTSFHHIRFQIGMNTSTGKQINFKNICILSSGEVFSRFDTKIGNIEYGINNSMLGYLLGDIVCCGDSLTQGYLSSQLGHTKWNYPNALSKMLGGTTVFNRGASGFTTLEWYNGLRVGSNFDQYDTAIIFLGTNGGLTDTLDTDVTPYSDYNDYAETNTGAYCKIIEFAKEKNSNIKIFLCKIFNSGGSVGVTITNEVIDKIATKYSLPVIDLNVAPLNSGTDSSIIHPYDNTHCGAFGYTFIAKKILDGIVKAISNDTRSYNRLYTSA